MPPKPKVAPVVWPSAAIQVAYQRDLRNKIIKPMASDLLRELDAAWRDDGSVTQDAPWREGDHPCDPDGKFAGSGRVRMSARWRRKIDESEYEEYIYVSTHKSVAAAKRQFEKDRKFAPKMVLRIEHIEPQGPEPEALAQDARPDPKKLRTVMERWGKRWTARLETLAEKMAREFAEANKVYTDAAVKRSLKAAGLTIQWRPTKRMLEGFAAVVYENVQLIKSIPQKFLLDVQSDVWLSATKGADRAALTEKIKHSYGVSWRRAAFISRDQTAKAKAVFEASRRAELGITKAVWMHSHAGREPRPTHVKMNGKTYDVAKGMWDADEGEFVHPGELINCRCSSGAVIPGFED